MSDDFKMIATATFGVITLAWVLIRSADVNTVTTSLATNYKTAVSALMPPVNG